MKVIKKYGIELVMESGKKYELDSSSITSPGDGAKVFREVFNLETATQEKFVMLALNTKNKVIGAFEIFVGTINCSIVHPRDVFQRLLLVNAASFMVAHNHPSGDPTPSVEDIEVTRRLKEVSKIMGIDILDHIILGENDRFCSLKERGDI